MNASQLMTAASHPYSALLKETTYFGKLFSSKQLAFNMEAQTETNWCWAATATSVSHFYWLFSTWTQCRVVNAELGRSDCCGATAPNACNVPWWLDKALTRTQNLVNVTGQATFQQVRDEIDAGRPVGARIGWSGGGGHFMVIYGYSLVAGTQYFDIDDPIYGKSHLTVTDFSTNYQGTGTWTDTYYTKSYFKMPIKRFIPKEPILRRIWEVRPLLNLKQGLDPAVTREAVQEQDAAIGLAHPVYAVGLDALLGNQEAPAAPVSLRVYEVTQGSPRAFFDVSDDAEARVQQMSTSKNHLEPFARALEAAVPMCEQSDQECELRLFRVPALNFEAVWISYDDKASDSLVPLRAVGPLQPGKPVPFDEAMKVLREAARPLAQMDDKMGA